MSFGRSSVVAILNLYLLCLYWRVLESRGSEKDIHVGNLGIIFLQSNVVCCFASLISLTPALSRNERRREAYSYHIR